MKGRKRVEKDVESGGRGCWEGVAAYSLRMFVEVGIRYGEEVGGCVGLVLGAKG